MRMILRSIFIDKLQQRENSANVNKENNYRGTRYNKRELKQRRTLTGTEPFI